MTPIQIIGIGLDGTIGLSPAVRQIVAQATLLVGSARHLSYFPDHGAERLVIEDFRSAIGRIREEVEKREQGIGFDVSAQPNGNREQGTGFDVSAQPNGNREQGIGNREQSGCVVVVTSGDPLFFGLGRLLLAELPAEWLTFHPHLSSVQLAFSRIKVAWQDARLISGHGRSLESLIQALQQGAEKIALLTDGTNSPVAVAKLLLQLDLAAVYQIWVCENLGGETERVELATAAELLDRPFAPLNVVILLRQTLNQPIDLAQLPIMGVPDSCFLSFADRPGLITKREVRLLVLGELALQEGQIVWDIGAGTGSVSVEMARLCPQSSIYAIEQTAAGISLIQKNSDRFAVSNVKPIHGMAPAALEHLPPPDRVFIGGSGGNLPEILDWCTDRLVGNGPIVLALATLEHLTKTLNWLAEHPQWESRLLQAQLGRSVPVASLTRIAPLNPVTIVTLERLARR